MSQTKKFGIVTLLLLFVAIPILAKPPITVEKLDLSRYQGKWFEMARFPNFFQKDCIKNVTAQYKILDTGFIEVINTCQGPDDSTSSVTGLAKTIDTESNAKLGVSFFDILGWRPIWGDYWVLYIDPEYQMAVVGDSQQKYGWILSRKKALPQEKLDLARAIFAKNGYDPTKIIYTTQD